MLADADPNAAAGCGRAGYVGWVGWVGCSIGAVLVAEGSAEIGFTGFTEAMVKPGLCELRRTRGSGWTLTSLSFAVSSAMAAPSAGDDSAVMSSRLAVWLAVGIGVRRVGLRGLFRGSAFAAFGVLPSFPNLNQHPKMKGRRHGRYRCPNRPPPRLRARTRQRLTATTSERSPCRNSAICTLWTPAHLSPGRHAMYIQLTAEGGSDWQYSVSPRAVEYCRRRHDPHCNLGHSTGDNISPMTMVKPCPQALPKRSRQVWPAMASSRASSSRPLVFRPRHHRVRRRHRTALREAGVPDDAPVGLVVRNRLPHAAAIIGFLAAGRPVLMIYSFQSPDAIGRDIEKLELSAIVAEREDWTEPVIDAAKRTGSAGVAISLSSRSPRPSNAWSTATPPVSTPKSNPVWHYRF